MKKFSLILLAAVLLASALTGCGHGESDTPDNDSVQNTSTTTRNRPPQLSRMIPVVTVMILWNFCQHLMPKIF